MRVVEITDPTDPRLADYRDLTDVALRRVLEPDGGLYIAESAKVIGRALAAGHRPRSILVQQKWVADVAELLADDTETPVYVVPADVAESLTGYAVHRGALAAMHRPELASVSGTVAGARTVLILDDIVDHTNVGAAFRSAAALGADAVLISPRCADPLYRRSVRVSMGTVFQVPWTRLPEWSQARTALSDLGFHSRRSRCPTMRSASTEFAADRPERVALLLGARRGTG